MDPACMPYFTKAKRSFKAWIRIILDPWDQKFGETLLVRRMKPVILFLGRSQEAHDPKLFVNIHPQLCFEGPVERYGEGHQPGPFPGQVQAFEHHWVVKATGHHGSLLGMVVKNHH